MRHKRGWNLKLKSGRRIQRGFKDETDFDPLLPSQVYDQRGYRRPATGEERMAWRFLERCVLDACQGPQRARERFISEIEVWAVTDEGADNPWSFGYWCSLLGVDEGFMAKKFMAFLMEQRENAKADRRGDFKILRQIEAVRIDQPHQLAKVMDNDATDCPKSLYQCLSCLHTGSWDDFLAYTCVRGQVQPAEVSASVTTQSELEEALGLEKGDLNEKGNNQPLNASDQHPVQDQGSRPNAQPDNGDSQGRRPDGGGGGSPSGVGAVASGPASADRGADVLRSIQALF